MPLNEQVTLVNSVPPVQTGGTTKWQVGAITLDRKPT